MGCILVLVVGFIGLLIGGPIGGIIGGVVGAFAKQILLFVFGVVSAILSDGEINKEIPDDTTYTSDSDLIEISYSMYGKMAKADGAVCSEEINAIKDIINEELDEEDKQFAKDCFNMAKSNNFTIYHYAEQLSEYESDIQKQIYLKLWTIATLDSKLHPREDEILEKILDHLDLPKSQYTEFKDRFDSDASSDIEECYKILDCSEGDTDAEIKSKYRQAVKDYHPDKIQSKELAKGFDEFAKEQTQKINQAYDRIKKHRESMR